MSRASGTTAPAKARPAAPATPAQPTKHPTGQPGQLVQAVQAGQAVQLVRNALRGMAQDSGSAHPGLLLQRGWPEFVQTSAENEGKGGKTSHIEHVCGIPAPDVYRRAYQRWLQATSDPSRFVHLALRVQGRLLVGLVGLGGGGALETGCTLSQTYGMPFLPGSSVKGVALAHARQALSGREPLLREMFGAGPPEAGSPEDGPATGEANGLSGLISFHDAWWVPDSAPGRECNKPFALDVVTPHHPDYSQDEGASPATDLDSPVPNAMVGVHGTFLFTLEGPSEWMPLARRLVEQALCERGIGAKTAAGYGFLVPDEPAQKKTGQGA